MNELVIGVENVVEVDVVDVFINCVVFGEGSWLNVVIFVVESSDRDDVVDVICDIDVAVDVVIDFVVKALFDPAAVVVPVIKLIKID